MRKALTVFAAAVLAGCAAQPELLKPTQSGFAEGVFRGASIGEVRSKIIDGCSRAGLVVEDSGTNQLVCTQLLSGGDAVLAQAIYGNAYSTTPEGKTRFSIYEAGQDVKVVATRWFETQMAFGQVRREPLNTNVARNDMQQFLFNLGAE